MKTMIDIPDALFRSAKADAAQRGQTLKDFVTEALQEKFGGRRVRSATGEPPWMAGFGKLRRLRRETARVQARIDEQFEVVEPEDRA